MPIKPRGWSITTKTSHSYGTDWSLEPHRSKQTYPSLVSQHILLVAKGWAPYLGDLLYNTRTNGSDNDLVAPDGLKQEKRRLNHDLPTAGHQAIDRIKARIKQKFFFVFWYSVAKDVSLYVTNCPNYNQTKKATVYGTVRMHENQTGSPMEIERLDFLDLIPKTPRGYAYVFMMVYWVVGVRRIAITDSWGQMLPRMSFFSRFGYPFQILTDQGKY